MKLECKSQPVRSVESTLRAGCKTQIKAFLKARASLGSNIYLSKEALCEAISDMWGNSMGIWSAAAENMGTLKEFTPEFVAGVCF